MRFSPQNQNDRTGAFDIELEGFGRIAHVDPFGADDPNAFRDLLCAAPDMLAVLKSAEEEIAAWRRWARPGEGPDKPIVTATVLASVRAAIARAEPPLSDA